MSGMQTTLPTCSLPPFIQGSIQRTVINTCYVLHPGLMQTEHSNPALELSPYPVYQRKQNGSPSLNNSMCSCKHFCVFSFLLATNFQRFIFIPPTLFLFIIPCKTIGVTERGCLVKMTGCACHPGKGGPRGGRG